MAALNQYIYVVGGFDGTRQLSSVERYDTENNVWTMVAPIKVARSALSLTVLDDKLYAMGGFDGHNFVSMVEVYDSTSNRWEEGTPLTSGRSGHASAVMFYQPSCASTSLNGIDMSFNKNSDQSSSSPDDNMQDGSSLSEHSMDVESSGSNSSTSQSYHGRQCVLWKLYGFFSLFKAHFTPDTLTNNITNLSSIRRERCLVNIFKYFKFLWTTTDLNSFAFLKFGQNALEKFICKVKKKNQLTTTSSLLAGPVNTLFINDIQPS